MGLRRLRRPSRAAAIAVAAATLGVGAPHAGADVDEKGKAQKRLGFDAAPLGRQWFDATSFGPWYSLHDGFGRTHVEQGTAGRILSLRTREAASAAETFSSLVRTRPAFGDVDFTVSVRTIAQLRRPAANPWEVGWVLWRYTDNRQFYSFIVKPNGWELAKQDSAYAGSQRFLALSSARGYPIGASYRIRVRHVGDTVTVWVNGARTVRYTDRERPYRSGSIALYAEDSAVHYSPLVLNPRR